MYVVVEISQFWWLYMLWLKYNSFGSYLCGG